MNPETNRFEPLTEQEEETRKNQTKEMERRLRQMVQGAKVDPGTLFRPNGEPVPKHWSVFTAGEHVVIKNYTFKVAYVGETSILFEPVGPVALEGVKDFAVDLLTKSLCRGKYQYEQTNVSRHT
jgi:hypothetical protein